MDKEKIKIRRFDDIIPDEETPGGYYNAGRADDEEDQEPLSEESEEGAGEGDEEEELPPYTVFEAIGQDNITQFFTQERLEEIAAECFDDYQTDETDFRPRQDRITELYRLALQVVETKSYPFENAANIKYPIITKAALAFAVLAYPAIVQGKDVVKGEVIGNDDGQEEVQGADGQPMMNPDTGKPMMKNAGLKAKKAQRVGTFMSHQVLNIMDGWEDDTNKIMHIIPIIGCAFRKTFYCPLEKKNKSVLVLPQYFIMNKDASSVETAARGSEIIDYYPHEIKEFINMGIFEEFDYEQTSIETKKDNYQESDPDNQGGSPANDRSKPHSFIEQHRRLDLDDDGYPEPYIVWLHKETRKVVRILPRFEEFDIEFEGEKENATVVRIQAQNYYTKYGLFPDPEGSPYDIGFGHYCQHLNVAVNTGINQLLDQGHMYTLGGGFIGDGVRIKSGELRFRPNEWKRMKARGGTIKDNIVPLPTREPSATLMLLLEFLVKAADEMTAMSRNVEPGGQGNMPALTMLMSVEQGLQVFKSIFRGIHRSLKREFRRLFYLNQLYLDQETYSAVLDDPSANVEDDFMTSSADVVPFSDPEIITNVQSMLQGQALYEAKDDPLLDPVEVRKRWLRSLNIPDVDKLVKVPPKSVDQVAIAQIAALEAQINDLKSQIVTRDRDARRKDRELDLKIEKAIFETRKMLADTQKVLSEVEGSDKDRSLELYNTLLNHLSLMKQEMKEEEEKQYARQAERPQQTEPAGSN